MNQKGIKILTLFMVMITMSFGLFPKQISAAQFTHRKMKTHLRWNVFVEKDKVQISKTGKQLIIRSLDNNNLKKIYDQIKKAKLSSNRYIQAINFHTHEKKNNISKIIVDLANDKVEVFTFYRDPERKYVMDYWIDEKLLDIEKKAAVVKGKKVEIKAPRTVKKKVAKVRAQKPVKRSTVRLKENPLYRDFRYGASFIWDYKPLEPKLKKIINLERKTPEYFYPVKDRLYQKDDKEAHLQLAVNLYKNKKYGLMYKTMKMYTQKYGDDINADMLEYLKANALLRTSFKTKGAERKIAINMFSSLAENASDYEMRSAISRYLISFYVENRDFVSALQSSKRYYVDSKENFDYERSGYAAEAILHSLAMLGQIEKVDKLISEKTIQKILAPQTLLAYKFYTNLALDDTESIVRDFKEKSSVMTKPIHPAILFNYAEASFRRANYSEAIKKFDEFLANYSFMTKASDARLRIAMSYDLTDRSFPQVEQLYKTAINKSSDLEKRYEAQVRYVALTNLRKRKIGEKDKELRVFLDKPKTLTISKDQELLLWQVRLRMFLVDGKFKEALSYLAAMPLKSYKPLQRRVFDGDGAEAVYGLVQNSYEKSEYSKIIKIWEVYREKYVQKVAEDPMINYMVARSYLKMGLLKGFDKVYEGFENLNARAIKTFPFWTERNPHDKIINLALELQVIRDIKLKNYQSAKRNVARLAKNKGKKAGFYQGIILYKNRSWKKAAKAFETFISLESQTKLKDVNELADLLHFYSDSLYNSKQTAKFLKVSEALLEDVENSKMESKYLSEVKERVRYLNLEIYNGMGDDSSSLRVEGLILSFKKDYPKSIYRGRVNYLLGKTFINNKKFDEGTKVFNDIVKDNDISDYIKELAKTELSYLKIKNRTI